MGNLLRVLAEKPVGPKVDFFVDFEKAEPTDGEREVHSQVAACLSQSAELLQQMKNYKGAGEEIKNVCNLIILFHQSVHLSIHPPFH